jgi:hypothetical protein
MFTHNGYNMFDWNKYAIPNVTPDWRERTYREDTSTRGGLNPCKKYADGRQKRRLQKKAKNGGRK